MYIKTDEFVNELLVSIFNDNSSLFYEKYSKIDILLFDDFQLTDGKERTQEELFRIFSNLLEKNKRLAIASRTAPGSLQFMGSPASSSINIGLIADIKPPDYEARVAILKKNCELENIKVSEEAIEHIAKEITSNVRELKNIFNRVIAYSILLNEDISMETVQKALEQ